MKLIIVEKPSVEQSVAKIVKATTRKDGYLEGNGYIVSWCVGHLVTLADADEYDKAYKKWDLSHLPILPENFNYAVGFGKDKQLDIVTKLLNKSDVECVINGCDAGREGELIFRLVYNYAKCNKPTKRLWISSMEDKAITDGLENLKKGSEYENLYNAALCRLQADWLVGINATRLFSISYNQILQVGRVMSPTLAMIVDRNKDISDFVSTPFYNVETGNDTAIFQSERIEDKELAHQILEICENHNLVIESVENTERTEKPPALYNLTTLQREANRNLGLSANETLDCVQTLYEKKLCTYPRTDSEFVTEDMEDGLEQICEIALHFINIKSTDVCNTKRVVKNKGVTDHHAIIPTTSVTQLAVNSLKPNEKAILNMIMLRFVCSTSTDHIYNRPPRKLNR